MNDTHKITITIDGKYPHGDKQHATISISGNGDLDHMLEAFKSALLAAGFSLDVVRKLDEMEV